MDTAQFFQSSVFNVTSDDFVVDSINPSVIESEKNHGQCHGYVNTPPIVSKNPIDLAKLTTLLQSLRTTDDVVFQVRSHSSCFSVTTRIGMEGLLQCSPVKLAALFQRSTQFSIHPYLWNYLNNFGDLDMDELSSWNYSNYRVAESLACHLNSRIENLRTDLRSQHTTRWVDNHHRGYRSNLASLKSYVADLFNRYSRLLVVRLDFGYQQGLSLNPLMAQHHVVVSSQPEHGVSSPHGASWIPRVGMDQIRQHRDALLAFIRQKYGEDFCGYVWKMEYGARKGYHFHTILFFNGSNLRKGVAIGALIGNQWKNVITAGRGNYYNCNVRSKKYVYPCTGMLSWNDPNLKTGFDYLCDYLMKPDLYARLELEPGQRTFGKGGSPLKGWEDQPRRGRQRSPS